GRYVVYCPNIDFVGISNKITDPARREMLMKLLEKHKPKGGGLIARTVCIAAKKNDILAEIHGLQTLYEKIASDYEKADGVCLLHSEGDLVFRAVRDMLTTDVERIICNERETLERLRGRLQEMGSDFTNKIEYYASTYDIWDAFDIGGEIEKLFERKVGLPSGGSLVIDPTEALTAIDVNTGRFTAEDHEETVFLTNIEAAKEIARQLRLRNIGGIIVVDFIDMQDEAHKAEVVEVLRNEVLLDRIKTRVRDMTELGLVEITRKKVGQPLSDKLMGTCEHCQGRGHRPNAMFAARKLRAFVNRALTDHDWNNVVVRMHAGLLEYMFSSRYFADICQNEWKDRLIYLVPDPRVKQLEYIITGNNDVALTLPSGARLLY
nr:ribonuclease E/G [Clostridiales bacterium]